MILKTKLRQRNKCFRIVHPHLLSVDHFCTILRRDLRSVSSRVTWTAAHWNLGMRPTTLRNGLLGIKNGDVGLSLDDDVTDGGVAVGVAKGGGRLSLRLSVGVSGRDEGREDEGVVDPEVFSALEIVTPSAFVDISGSVSVSTCPLSVVDKCLPPPAAESATPDFTSSFFPPPSLSLPLVSGSLCVVCDTSPPAV